jgi:DHA1 family bicyclomycin/chloramphenicol resistance-like MFS transporter
MLMVHGKVRKDMGLIDLLKREFSFITGNYFVLIISWIIMDLANEMPAPNFQYYVRDILGGTGIALGLIGLAGFLGMAAVAFPGGYLADKHGRRWLISTMTFGLALSYLLFAFAPTWHFILVGTIIGSLCLIYQPALFALLQDSLPQERRGMGSSIIQLIQGTFNTPGPIIAGFLLLQLGLEWSMRLIYLIMTTCFVIAAIWRLRLRETMTNREPIRFRYFISSYPKAMKESFNVWKVVPKSMLWLLISQILTMFGMSLFNVINALYARDTLGIPENQWWLVFIPLLLTMVVAAIPVGKMVDKIGRKIPLILGLVVFSIGAAIFLFGNLFTLMAAMIFFGLGSLLFGTGMLALTADLVGTENRGKVSGFTNFTSYIISGIGMLLGNYLYVNFFPQLPFYIALAVMLPTFVIVFFLVHEPAKRAD